MANNAIVGPIERHQALVLHSYDVSNRGKTEHIYGEVDYAGWQMASSTRVVIKAESVRATEKDPKDNPRFVTTNMKQSPQWIYERVYCQRGDVENRIKALREFGNC